MRTLFIATARLLFGFDLKLAKDESGNDIPIDPYVSVFLHASYFPHSLRS